jgi:hypothetical protein
MKRFAIFFLFVFLISTMALSQNYQVSNIQGTESISQPILDIQGSTARITHDLNFRFYSFPAAGPAAPISLSQAVHPANLPYGPDNVVMQSNGNNIVICYITYETTPTTGWWLEYVVSSNGGSTWGPSVRMEKVESSSSLSLYSDNVILKKTTLGTGTALLYYRDFLDHQYIHMSNNHGFGAMFGPLATFPAGDTLHAISNMSCFGTTISGNDNIFSVYTLDSSIYMIRHIPGVPPGTPGSPTKILSMGGMTNYYPTHLVGNPNGLMYMSFGYIHWVTMMDWSQGTLLYKSTDYGNTWSFADTLDQNNQTIHELQLTSTGTLIFVQWKNSNIYLKSSFDGKTWSTLTRVNPTANTTTGKSTSGFSSALIDDANIGIAWIDTTTGYDEFFYRSMAIPTAPTVGVAEIKTAPKQFALDQNYPNPFNPTTVIRYQLAKSGMVNLKIFDLLGKEVAVLVNEEKAEGTYSVTFHAVNLPSGVYFYRLESNGNAMVKKLVLMK